MARKALGWTTLAVVAAVAIALANGFTQRVCPGKPADLIVVMDESSSIWPVHFRKQREFLANLTDGFEISADKTRIAVVSFADDYTLRFNLDTFSSNEEVKAAVNKIAQKTGGTRTDAALEFVRTSVLAKARVDVPRIVILVTDGASWYPERTKKQAELLRRLNVSIIAVAISNQINWDEINAIATKPLEKHAFSVTSFDGLGQQLVSDLVDTTCEIKSEPPPVTMPHPERELVGKQKPPGMPTIRVYSERTAVLTRDGLDSSLVWLRPDTAMAGREPVPSERPRHGSLQGRHGSFTLRGNEHLTAEDNGDGASRGSLSANGGSGHERVLPSSLSSSENQQRASISVRASWSSRDGPNTIEIVPISASHVAGGQTYLATDVRKNEPHTSAHHRVLVHEPATRPPPKGCRPTGRVDVAMVLGSLHQNPRGGDAAMIIVEGFLRETAASLAQHENDDVLRVALVPSGCQPDLGFGWSELSNPQAIVKQLAQRRNKLPQVADYLNYVRDDLFSSRQHQPQANVSRIAIVILDRPVTNPDSTLQAVRRLQEQGTAVAFISVGLAVEPSYLRTLAQNEQLIFTVSSYSHTDAIKSFIRTIVCQ